MPTDDSRSERTRLAEELRRSFDGPAWHGPALADLDRARDALLDTLAHVAEHRLGELAPVQDDAPMGGTFTHADVLHGLAQHNAYHGGQVALLRKALAATRG